MRERAGMDPLRDPRVNAIPFWFRAKGKA